MARGKPEKYLDLSLQLRQLAAALPDGGKLPSERELATRFQCNHLTVRKALRILEQENFLHKIPGRGSFIGPRPVIRGKDLGMVGFIFPDDEIYYYKLFFVLEKTLSALNLHPIVHVTGGRAAKEDAILEYLDRLPATALIAVPNVKCAANYRKLTIPTVFFDVHPADCPMIPYVVSDDYDGARQVVEHLLRLGHRQIAHIGGATDPSAAERRRGFHDALCAFGITPRAEHIKCQTPTREWGYTAMRELLSGGRVRPSAVFCGNDTIAGGAVRACIENGLRLPREVTVVGFGNTAIAEDLNISSVSQHTDKIANALKEAMQRLLTGLPPAPSATIPTQLIIR